MQLSGVETNRSYSRIMDGNVLFCILLSCTCVTEVYSESFFTRQQQLDDRQLNEASTDVLPPVPLQQCARNCHNASFCQSLLYNANDGTCTLLSLIHVNTEVGNTEPGNKIYQKRDDQSVCEIPTKGRLLSTDGLREGSEALFVCDDYYFPTTEAGVCSSSGTWTGLDNPCQAKASSPYTIPAARMIDPGACFVIMATPTANTSFYLHLVRSATDIDFTTDTRFDYLGDVQKIVRSTLFNGTYGNEERDTPVWPFELNREFNLTLCAEDTLYRMYVDNSELLTFAYRSNVSGVTEVQVAGDVVLRKIRFYP